MLDPMDLTGIGANAALLGRARSVIESEASAADDGRWEDWLACFTEDCEYWVPSWRGDGRLSDDFRAHVSHIYYNNKQALRDRAGRFISPHSPASNPAPRILHMFSNFRLKEDATPERVRTRCNWATHIFQIYARETHVIFGTVEHEMVREDDKLLICRKKVVYMNDYIPSMLDIYMF